MNKNIMFFIKLIISYIIILFYNYKIKTKNIFIDIQNYRLIKSLYNMTEINIYINYLNDCKSLKRINNKNITKRKNPFLSICISTYNSEKYIEKSILSIINQSFQDFEIIVINDNSSDKTLEILMKLQKEDARIKIINHSQNLGAYHSRVEGVLNSNSTYILFIDPDDMIFNPFLFEKVYDCSLNYNLDIIEYTVFYQIEETNKFQYPLRQDLNHYHNYSNKIIYQPELSNIIYYIPNSKEYSFIICRVLWNKIYKKNIVLESINYIGNSYYNNYYILIAEDTLLNIILFNFAKNYTNLNIPGYLYSLRKSSISNLNEGTDFLKKKSISIFLYLCLLYRYIKEFDKDRNYLYYELLIYGSEILNMKKYNNTNYYLDKAKIMLNDIIYDNKANEEFKNYIKNQYKAILN